ncbi:MAG: phage scaffolding protein [Peptoniphilus sp.]|nr:phage scaffolding protein [Peptoniphilus sp.]MDY3118188.1 phage scaffolding protein [Peptoniphilus sp.]
MKREFLEGLKLEKDAVDAIMAENGKDIEREKARTEEEKTQKDLLERQLKEATKTIQSYKDMDVDAIKASAAEWEEKAKANKKELEDYKHGVELEKKVSAYHVKDVDLIVKLLDRDSLRFKDGEVLGLDEQIRALQKDKGFLFDEDTPEGEGERDTRFTPFVPNASQTSGAQAKTSEEEIAEYASKARLI